MAKAPHGVDRPTALFFFLRRFHQVDLPAKAAAAARCITLDEIFHDQFALAFIEPLIDKILHDAVDDPVQTCLFSLR
ncbi:MAG: hypothetical protein ACT6QU_12845 [Aliihoeflea sp.]|uniref:hypothetical protein n=1 Tax=Aliihoeflea sp. TaxID=2608088 RepID=UPI0040378F0E